MKYYYCPFSQSDGNERDTWLKYGSQCPFVTSTAPCTADYMLPADLARQLAGDGLQNRRINIRLMSCFGGGRSELFDDLYGEWRKSVGDEGVFALKLALALGTAYANVRVAGYLGATNSKQKGMGMLINIAGTANMLDRFMVTHKRPADPSTYVELSLDQLKAARARGGYKGLNELREAAVKAKPEIKRAAREIVVYVTPEPEAGKPFIAWYDTAGHPSAKHKGERTGPPAAADASRPLSAVQDFDTVLVMGHGFPDEQASIGQKQRVGHIFVGNCLDANMVKKAPVDRAGRLATPAAAAGR